MHQKFNYFLTHLKYKQSFNSIYFFSLLLFLIGLNLRHFFVLESPLSTLFLFYALGQAFFEVAGCAFILLSLERWAFRGLSQVFIALSFILCLVHFTDFTLIRLMDAPISYVFKFLFYSGFLKVFEALNWNFSMVAITICTLLAVPLAGPLFYWATSFLAKRWKTSVSLYQVGMFLGCVGSALLLIDLSSRPFLKRPGYAQLQKTLPFKGTFLHPPPQRLALAHSIRPLEKEEALHNKIPFLSCDRLPNIYVFVIETLRKDFLTVKTAPAMMAFADSHLGFSRSFANSSGTHASWFAIFHSNFPYHWTHVRDHWKKGALPLHILKRLGYKIHVFSSANLRYFDMNEVLFGKEGQLVDKRVDLSSHSEMPPWEKDAFVMQAVEEDLSEKQGVAHFIFLDSTHSEYSFPPDFPLDFGPIVRQIDYLTLTPQKIEPLKNRYRTAIAYVDGLVGHFFSTLKEKGLYSEALIAITGDHGEEFFEEGALFHGTHLNRFQTEVPIFCKFPQRLLPWVDWREVEITHMDLFPSLLHALTGSDEFSFLFQGKSVFSQNRWPYRMAVLHNGPYPPQEFLIAQGKKQLRLRFLTKEIYHHKELELMGFETPEKVETSLSLEKLIELHFPASLEPLVK